MNDIIPPHKRRSIRDIPIPNKSEDGNVVRLHNQNRPYHDNTKPVREENFNDELIIEKNSENEERNEELTDPRPRLHTQAPKRQIDDLYTTKRNSTPKKVVLGSVLTALLLFFIVLAFRNGAEVMVEPKAVEVIIATEIVAIPSTQESSDALTFSTELITVEVSEKIAATGEETVVEEATGQITIYNEYSDEPQRLIAQTRFESPEGYIYRIQESVTVPGKTGDQPGSITVTVVADEAGESYNIEKTDFTIPGFAGQPQFDSMYAKSETAMTGGYDGVRKFVEAEKKTAAEATLTEKAVSALNEKLNNLDTENYVFSSPSLQSFNLTQSDDNDTVTFTMKADAIVVVLQKNELDNTIAAASLTTFNTETEQVILMPSEDFSINIEPEIVAGSNRELAQVRISAEGSTQFLWDVDTDSLAQTLAGTERKTFRNILESVSGVQKAEVTIKPFWKNSFPEKSEKITITVEDGNL